MLFCAVELKSEGLGPEQVVHEAIKHFMQAAASETILFSKAVVFGPIEAGARPFLRLYTDCASYPPLVKRLLKEGRGIVAPTAKGFLLFLPDGREGPVSFATMQSVMRIGYGQVYRGPKMPFWQRQFEENS